MTQEKPFEIMRWASRSVPTVEVLSRILAREGLKAESIQRDPHTHSMEMKFDKTAIRVMVSGQLQYSFPGYGVIELMPGDILEIQPDVLHDVMVSGENPAVVLEALR